MPLSELNGSIVPIYVDKCRPAESRTWIVVLLCNKSTFQGHVPYVMNNSGLILLNAGLFFTKEESGVLYIPDRRQLMLIIAIS